MSKSTEKDISVEETTRHLERLKIHEKCSTEHSKRNSLFEEAYIEHEELDVFIVDTKNKVNLGRPWASLLIDANTGIVLGLHVSINPPSFVSNMMVIRECVKRNSKLPKTIIIDGGKEFINPDFQDLMAKYSIAFKIKPLNKRYYKNFERFFRINENSCIEKISDKIRRLAVMNFTSLTIDGLKKGLQEVFYDCAFQDEHSSQYMTRNAYLKNQILKMDEKPLIEYDENFEIMTCPSPPKKTATIFKNKGVKINNIYYWSKKFENADKKRIPVKYDPLDSSIAYAYLNSTWIKLSSK